MILVDRLLRYFSLRRLRLRATQIVDAARSPLATIYPREISFPAGERQRVLVLTPHADDETFGVGGTLLRHIARGDDVHVVLFSDNVASIDDPAMDGDAVRTLRADEFRAAMTHLGIRHVTLLDLPDARFRAGSESCPELAALFVENPPDVLYLPSLFDNHHDHRVLNIWMLHTVRTVPVSRMLLRGFEVWSPLPATTVADISAEVATKREAMRLYGSQNDAIDYVHHILGLNAYRAMTFGGKRATHAEAFLELSADDYRALALRSLPVYTS
jgi:N-acetylglucosamine malate deacetylase 1